MPPQDQMPSEPIYTNSPQSSSVNKSIGILVIAFVVLLTVSVYMMRWSGVFVSQEEVIPAVSKPTYTQDKVIVKAFDLSKNVPTIEKIPAVFGKNIPLPKDAVITESLSTNYVEKNIQQSVFTFSTSLTQKDVYEMYETYMTKQKYVFTPDGKKIDTYLFGQKANDDLTVVIGSNGTSVTVTVVYLDRK